MYYIIDSKWNELKENDKFKPQTTPGCTYWKVKPTVFPYTHTLTYGTLLCTYGNILAPICTMNFSKQFPYDIFCPIYVSNGMKLDNI